MDEQEEYIIPESIKDAIRILDSAPVRPDLVEGFEFMQLANRLPLAHLAIERGLKELIIRSGGERTRIHDLVQLYKLLRESDNDWAEFLTGAFQDAVKFYGYNTKRKEFKHYQSLITYLCKTGTEIAFQALRYWPTREPGQSRTYYRNTSILIQRELLRAIFLLFRPLRNEDGSVYMETVSERVSDDVSRTMLAGATIANSDSAEKQQAATAYRDWLISHISAHSALTAAIKQKFVINKECEGANQLLFDTYKKIEQSKDPAVLYYLSTLNYLSEGSQQRQGDAIAEINWWHKNRFHGSIITPAKGILGLVHNLPNNAWMIESHLDNTRRIAWKLGDAMAYLVNHCTRRVEITVKGQSKQLRIVTQHDTFSPNERLEFWDTKHGLSDGDKISVKMLTEANRDVKYVLAGTVEEVRAQTVRVSGRIEFRRGNKVVASMSGPFRERPR